MHSEHKEHFDRSWEEIELSLAKQTANEWLDDLRYEKPDWATGLDSLIDSLSDGDRKALGRLVGEAYGAGFVNGIGRGADAMKKEWFSTIRKRPRAGR